MSKPSQTDWRQVFILVGMFLIILVLWNTPVVYPVKIFVVLLHELGHTLAALATGGQVHMITLSPMQGGETFSSGGNALVVLPAGYLGSMIFGGLILAVAARTKADKAVSFVIGLIVILVTLFYIRYIFGFMFGIVFGAGLAAMGILAPRIINDYFLKFIGLTSILYAVLDIKDDLITRTVRGSDAYQMSKIIPLPSVVWGIIWMAVSIIAAAFFLKIAVKKEPARASSD